MSIIAIDRKRYNFIELHSSSSLLVSVLLPCRNVLLSILLHRATGYKTLMDQVGLDEEYLLLFYQLDEIVNRGPAVEAVMARTPDESRIKLTLPHTEAGTAAIVLVC